MILSDTVVQAMDHWLAKFPADQRRSAVVGSLLAAQKDNGGWLSEEVMQAVADYLEITLTEVYEVATFYDMFFLNPVGKHKIAVCTNISCMLRGSEELVKALEDYLGVKLGETTADGQFSIQEVECLATCANAPVCQINDGKIHRDVTPDKIVEMLQWLQQGDRNVE